MACLSNKYLADEKDEKTNDSATSKNSLKALIYIVGSDLLPMLMASDRKIDRLPVVYLAEANA